MDGKIQAMASEMGVSYADMVGFVGCLQVWINKGYSLADAIQKNLETLANLAANVSEGFSAEYGPKREAAEALKAHLAGEIWEAVRGEA